MVRFELNRPLATPFENRKSCANFFDPAAGVVLLFLLLLQS